MIQQTEPLRPFIAAILQVQILEFLAYLGLVVNLLLCSLRHDKRRLTRAHNASLFIEDL